MHNSQSTYKGWHGSEENVPLGLEEDALLELEEDMPLLEKNEPVGLEKDMLPGFGGSTSI